MESQTPATGGTSAPLQPSSEASQSQPSQLAVSLPPSSSSAPSTSAPVYSSPNPNPIPNQTPNPNPIPNSRPPTPIPHPSSPAPTPLRSITGFNRNLPLQPQQQQSHYSHFSSVPPPSSAPGGSGSSFSTSGATSVSGTPAPRGGMAIGVPPHHQNSSSPFSPSFGQHFGGLGRTGVNISDSTSNSNTAQVWCMFPGCVQSSCLVMGNGPKHERIRDHCFLFFFGSI